MDIRRALQLALAKGLHDVLRKPNSAGSKLATKGKVLTYSASSAVFVVLASGSSGLYAGPLACLMNMRATLLDFLSDLRHESR